MFNGVTLICGITYKKCEGQCISYKKEGKDYDGFI